MTQNGQAIYPVPQFPLLIVFILSVLVAAAGYWMFQFAWWLVLVFSFLHLVIIFAISKTMRLICFTIDFAEKNVRFDFQNLWGEKQVRIYKPAELKVEIRMIPVNRSAKREGIVISNGRHGVLFATAHDYGFWPKEKLQLINEQIRQLAASAQ